MSEQEGFEEWENIQPREYFWNDLNKEIAFLAWQACAERKNAELAALREENQALEDEQSIFEDAIMSKDKELAALRECLEWYAEKITSLSVYSNAKPPLETAILALMHEMMLDAGKRAEALLTGETE